MSEWDFKSMGFITKEEMEASLARVRAAKEKPMSDLAQRAANHEKNKTYINEYGGIEFTKLNEGARLEELDKEVSRRLYWEAEQAKQAKRDEAINDLLKKAGEATRLGNEAKAEAAIREENEKAVAEIRAKHMKENNLKSDDEVMREEAFRKLLAGLRGE
jgi:hypothetical protein